MKEEMERRFERAKKRERKVSDSPEVVIKVVCKYRAELFFKVSRKTKLGRLFNVWTERMEVAAENARSGGETRLDKLHSVGVGSASASASPVTKSKTKNTMQFLFTHLGKIVDGEQSPDDLGIEGGDEIVAVEMMDLTTPNEAVIPLDHLPSHVADIGRAHLGRLGFNFPTREDQETLDREPVGVSIFEVEANIGLI